MNNQTLMAAIASIVFAGTLSAQAVLVTGAGDPDIDVPAVQAAIDQGGQVVLSGHFSFDTDPNRPPGAAYARMITVTKTTAITGSPDANGEMPVIDGGNWPFFVDAAGSHVTFRGLHFVGSEAGAIWVYAVSGLLIDGCRIEGPIGTAEFGVQAGVSTSLAGGIAVFSDPHPPSGNFPGIPGNFAGKMEIVNNNIDMNGQPGSLHLGIVISVGRSPDQEVDIHVAGNTVIDVTEPAINFRLIGGRVLAEGNTIRTGSVLGGGANPDAFRIVGSGSHLITHKSIDCSWPDPAATGINVLGQPPPLQPATNAIIVDNDVSMSPADGVTFANNSAGIEVGGIASGIEVNYNRVRGHAAAALSVSTRNGRSPSSNIFVANDIAGFQGSLGDILVDAGVTGTLVIGPPMHVEDRGSGTMVVPAPGASSFAQLRKSALFQP